MIARPVAVRFHPYMLTGIQIDRRDPPVRRLEERQPSRPAHKFSRSVLESEVRAVRISRNQVRGESSSYRRYIQDASIGIECSTIPICAAHRSRQLERAFRVIRPVTLERWRSVQRPNHILFADGESLRSKFRREIDQIIHRDTLAFEWGRFSWKRLRRRSSFAGCGRDGNGTFLNRPDRLPCYAIKYENESFFRNLRDSFNVFAVDRDVAENGRSRQIVVPEVVMNSLKMPDSLARLSLDANEAVAEKIIAEAMTAVHVACRRRQGQVDVAQLFVCAEIGPGIDGARVFP